MHHVVGLCHGQHCGPGMRVWGGRRVGGGSVLDGGGGILGDHGCWYHAVGPSDDLETIYDNNQKRALMKNN